MGKESLMHIAITGNRNPYLPLPTYIPDGEDKLFDGWAYSVSL